MARTRSLLRTSAVAVQDRAHSLRTNIFTRVRNSRVQQQLQSGRVLAIRQEPAACRSMQSPVNRCTLIIVGSIVERRPVAQDEPHQFRIAMPGGPMERGRVVLAVG